MASQDFSGEEIYKAMVNSSVGWVPVRTTGDHMILRWDAPEDHDSENRTISIPLHDSIPRGTLGSIAEDAGAESVDMFCEWIESNL
ncbi:MAG: type II toxin-antitoxin system HicA family toxin [Halobacteriaceae archaeon]